MKFNYQARTKTGEIQTGTVEASSREVAIALLQRYGLYVTILEEVTAPPIYAKKIVFFSRISGKEIVLFSRQLSIMFRSKVPLVEALEVLASQTKNLHFKEKMFKLAEEVEGGTSFSGALARYPELFSTFYISMVKAGEVSGKLAESLNYLADHLEREYHLTSRLRGALMYPALIVFVVVLVLILMIFFVIPQLKEVLEGTGVELPFLTKLVIGFSDFFKKWGWILILILIGSIGITFRYYQTKRGKKFFDKLFLRPPIIGPFLKMVYLSRFAENLSTLISGGLPITQSLETVRDIIGNTSYKEAISETRDEVRRGESISSVLARFPEVFPPVFIQMTLVGEKTGTLDKTLMHIVDFYREEIDRAVDSFLSILEPVLIIILGLIVAGIMLSILTPLYKMIAI